MLRILHTVKVVFDAGRVEITLSKVVFDAVVLRILHSTKVVFRRWVFRRCCVEITPVKVTPPQLRVASGTEVLSLLVKLVWFCCLVLDLVNIYTQA